MKIAIQKDSTFSVDLYWVIIRGSEGVWEGVVGSMVGWGGIIRG